MKLGERDGLAKSYGSQVKKEPVSNSILRATDGLEEGYRFSLIWLDTL